jgi:hypothetical protein
MKRYLITFMDDITKTVREKTIRADNKTKAKKKFNDMYYRPYPIISIELIKETAEEIEKNFI